MVEPDTVDGSGPLGFTSINAHVTTLLFQLAQNVVPNWFGVAVPRGVTDFSRPNIFFHPIPGQDGYVDGDYAEKKGKWPDLFYYMELLGYQLDAAIQNFSAPANQVVIMPFLTSGATSTGILPANWQGIVTDILTDTQEIMGLGSNGAVHIQDLVVSSFSVGYVYSENFRRNGVGVSGYLRQVWDFDGYPKSDSSQLLSTSAVAAIKYDQGSEAGCVHVPLSRWASYPSPPPNEADPAPPTTGTAVHGLIRDFLFLSAATKR